MQEWLEETQKKGALRAPAPAPASRDAACRGTLHLACILHLAVGKSENRHSVLGPDPPTRRPPPQCWKIVRLRVCLQTCLFTKCLFTNHTGCVRLQTVCLQTVCLQTGRAVFVYKRACLQTCLFTNVFVYKRVCLQTCLFTKSVYKLMVCGSTTFQH
jgi:hypothetical protein